MYYNSHPWDSTPWHPANQPDPNYCEFCDEPLDRDGFCENTYRCYADGRDVECYECEALIDETTGKMVKNKIGDLVAVCACNHQLEVA